MFLVMGVSLYTSRIVLAELGVVDYGIFNVVGGIIVMFSFINGAMASSTQRFLSFEIGRGNTQQLEKTFKTAVTIHLIIAGSILILAETVGLWFLNSVMNIPHDKIVAANWVFQCSVLGYIISIIQVPYSASIIARESMSFYAYMGIVDVCIRLGIAFSLGLVVSGKLILYSSLLFGVAVLSFIIYSSYSRHKFKECKFGWLYEKAQFKEMASYAGWSTFGSLAWAGKSQGLNILLNVFFGPTVNAAYGVANQVNVAVNNFVQNFTTALNPQIVKNYSSGNYTEMRKLVIYGAKFSFFLMLVIAFPVIMIADQLLHFWLVKVPEYAVVFTQLVIINTLIESFTFSMGTGIQATGNIKWYQIIVGGTLLLNIPISYLLLKLYLFPPIVFFTNILLSCITIGERLIVMRNQIPGFSILNFCKKVYIPAGIICSICGGIYYLTHCKLNISNYHFIYVALISFVLAFGLEWLIGLNHRERNKIVGIIFAKFKIRRG